MLSEAPAHATLPAADLARARHFYEKVVGLVPARVTPGGVFYATGNGTQVFVFPSLYEGFGLPVAEAMACGCPVISSNTSSLPEVAGEAALLAAPDDVRGWAEALARVCTDPALRADLSAWGPRQAARFTWEAAAAQTRALYRGVYARRH